MGMRSIMPVTMIIAALAFGLVAPAVAQPFADVPTNHWAYDAVAELAAKGLVEGYPDGTFKGDRAMTRYEMAMVVARLLSRIEAIQIPGPQTPEVTKADLETIQRLVNEFRAELTALGVRVTTIESELNAIKSKLDNVRVSGAFRFRYDAARVATGPSLNGGLAASVGAGRSAVTPQAREAFKLAFDASVAPEVHVIASLLSNGTGGAYAVFNSASTGAASPWVQTAIDNLFFDWKNAFGWPVEIWLGRFGGTELGTTYPVQFGPFGLLMNTGGDTWEDSTADSAVNVVDGLRVAGAANVLRGLQWQAVIARVTGNTGAQTYFSGEDAYGVDANVGVMPGLRLGAYYVGNNITNPAGIAAAAAPADLGARWHLYGPGGGSLNPATPNCPANAAGTGIQCPAAGSGGGGYVNWDIAMGIHLDGEYAQWNDAVHGTSDSGWQANVTWDLDKLLHAHGLSLLTGYVNYGQNFYPPYGAAEADFPMADVLYPGNAQGFTAQLMFNPTDKWTIYGTFVGGNNISNSQSLTEWEAGVGYAFAPNAKITFLARDLRTGGVEQLQLYRAQLDYQF